MTIFEIDREIERILSEIDEETGEIPESAFDELEQLQLSREEKTENAACLFLALTAEAKAIREQELVLADRRRAKERRADRIKKYIEYATEGKPFQTARVDVRWRRSSQVELSDAFWEHPDPVFVRFKEEPNKEAIKTALKAGMEVPGAVITEKTTITIK